MIIIKSRSVLVRCLVLYVLLSFSFFSCTKLRNGHRSIDFFNDCDSDLWVDGGYRARDTIWTSYPWRNSSLVKSHTSSQGPLFLDYWNTYEDDVFTFNRTIRVFIYRADKLPNKEDFLLLSYEERKEFLSTRCCRYDLTIDDLQELDWRISFPPDERMNNVKMYISDDYL